MAAAEGPAPHLGPVVLDAHARRGRAGVVADAHHEHVRALVLPAHGQLRKDGAHLRTGRM